MNKRIVLLITTLLLLSMATHTMAQTPQAGQTFAAVSSGVLTIFNADGTASPVNNPPNNGFFNPAWSPDGSKLAYILIDQTYAWKLMVTDSAGSDPITLDAADYETGFPLSFAPDGMLVYTAHSQQPAPNERQSSVDVNQIAPVADAQPETVGNFAYQSGCGGGSMLPADWRYYEEAGFGGSGMIFKMTSFGLLHSTSCGGLGLALLNLQTGEDKPIGPDVMQQQGPSEGYGNAVLSPDGKQITAIYTRYSEPTLTRSLAVIDLATLAITDVKTLEMPIQLAWGTDGSIFYSAITPTANLLDTLTADQQQKLGDLAAMDLRDNVVQILQVNPATAADTSIYQGNGYAIGRLAASADGQSLIFSQVANVDAWVSAIADGALDINTDIDGSAQSALVPLALYRLNLAGDKSVTALGENLMQFTLQSQAS